MSNDLEDKIEAKRKHDLYCDRGRICFQSLDGEHTQYAPCEYCAQLVEYRWSLLVKFLDAIYGNRIAPYDWSFKTAEAFEELKRAVKGDT